MIALGGPKLKHTDTDFDAVPYNVSMIALGGPKLKLCERSTATEMTLFQ